MKAIFKNLLVSLALLMIGAASAYAQPSLKGKVTDASGQPLPGVAVMVSGTSNGTMTDENGNYVLSGLKTGDVVLFTSLGMGDQTFTCDGNLTNLNVTLTEDSTFLEETIVVGYGTQKKSSMTSAVSAMKGDELLRLLRQMFHSFSPDVLLVCLRCRNPVSRALTRLLSVSVVRRVQ